MGRDGRRSGVNLAEIVSIHAPAWGATTYAMRIYEGLTFQFTRPHGARPINTDTCPCHRSFQFTRPHGARLRVPLANRRTNAVSIHAPAWGATRQLRGGWLVACFNSRARMGRDATKGTKKNPTVRFNSRARMGRDVPRQMGRSQVRRFNSRARMGRDFFPWQRDEEFVVSIHAPAWGATPRR